ncbi:hypothetical protein ACOME3_003829 [Neoechinorhynchus agilis]
MHPLRFLEITLFLFYELYPSFKCEPSIFEARFTKSNQVDKESQLCSHPVRIEYNSIHIKCGWEHVGHSLSDVLNNLHVDVSSEYVFIYDIFFDEIPNNLSKIFPSSKQVSIYAKRKNQPRYKISKLAMNRFKHLNELVIQNVGFTEVEDNAFEKFKELTNLDLCKNNIAKLGNGFHEHLSKLQILVLADNNLNNDCLLSIIQMNDLEELDLSNNLIEKFIIPNGPYFAKLRKLTIHDNPIREIQLNRMAKFEKLEILKFTYTLKLSELFKPRFQFSALNTFEIDGGQAGRIKGRLLKKMPNVNDWIIRNSNLKKVPEGNRRTNEITKMLSLRGNKISSLRHGDLLKWTNLTNLDISYNKIRRIRKDVFLLLKKLIILNLSGNKLARLPENMLKQNVLLQKIYLAENKLISLPLLFLNNLNNLNLLDLSYNRIKILYPIELGSKNVETCKVKNNSLSVVVYDEDRSGETFLKLSRIAELMPKLTLQAAHVDRLKYFSETSTVTSFTHFKLAKIKDVHRFTGEREIVSLDLSYNEITIIGYDDLNSLKSLKFLCLQFNEISKVIPRAFRNMGELLTLDLANNQLSILSAVDVFYGLEKVIFLHMANNGIQDFPYHSMQHFKNLRILNISLNPITHLDGAAFKELKSITEVCVDKTEIETINYF